MSEPSLKSLLEAGVHFGHQVSRWNPRMKPYLFSARNGIHIINLEQTLGLLKKAHRFIEEQVAHGGKVLFVGTKPQAQESIGNTADRTGMYYVRNRWLGGMLTNYRTIKQSIDKMKAYYVRKENGELEKLPKKEQVKLAKLTIKMERSLGGIRDMEALPVAVVIVDPNREHIAQKEANRLRIPVIALADSNCDPDGVDFLIPGNDDAIRSIQLVMDYLGDACEAGMMRRQAVLQEEAAKRKPAAPSKKLKEQEIGKQTGRAFVTKPEAGEPLGTTEPARAAKDSGSLA